MRVVVDANLIIERDWHLMSGTSEALLAAARRGRMRLVLPDVVVREVVAAHAKRRAGAESKLGKARADLRKLDRPLASDERPSKPAEPLEQRGYEDRLRERLRENRVEVAAIPEVSEDLVDRALRRRRPFDDNGRVGFRDALIWHTVLDDASSAQVTVFATDNVKDFAGDDKESLHAHLLEDVAAKGLDAGAIRLVRSLEEAARIALEPASELLDRLRERLATDTTWSDELLELMRQEEGARPAVDDTGVSVSIESRGEPFEGDVVDSELDHLTIVGPPLAVDAFPLTEDVYALILEASAEAVYELEVSTGGFTRQPHRVPTDLKMSEDERSAYFVGFANVRALFDARYHADSEQLTDLSLMGIADD